MCLSPLFSGTDFTCEVEPDHFYFLGRQHGSPVFRRQLKSSDRVCSEVGASALRDADGIPTPMTRGCFQGFVKYMIDYGLPQADLEKAIDILKRSMTETVTYPIGSYVICRRKYFSVPSLST